MQNNIHMFLDGVKRYVPAVALLIVEIDRKNPPLGTIDSRRLSDYYGNSGYPRCTIYKARAEKPQRLLPV
jgi:hypothetical protein